MENTKSDIDNGKYKKLYLFPCSTPEKEVAILQVADIEENIWCPK